jgi:hypothetical protein
MSDIKCEYSGIKIVPAELAFEIEEGSPDEPAWKRLYVEQAGPGSSPHWDAVADVDWVILFPPSGDAPGSTLAGVHSTGKPVGDYLANVTFNSKSATNAPQYAGIKLTVKPKPKPLKIITPSLPDGELNKAYECQIEAEGGVPPYIWTCIGVPEGLEFYIMPTPQIGGTPTVTGDFPITISAQDANHNPVTKEFNLHIAAPVPQVKIAIMSPLGGEFFYEGDTEDITWVAENADDETLDIHLILNGVVSIIEANIPVKSLGYLWTISGAVVSENAVIELMTNYQTVKSGVFAIRERSGCLIPWSVARLLKKVRKWYRSLLVGE